MHLKNFTTRRIDGQYIGTLEGDLPTPCWEIVHSEGHWDGHRYQLKLSAADKGRICAQVVTPFRHEVHLGRLRTGQYCLIVNGQEFWFGVD
jgi:hypothetical protein